MQDEKPKPFNEAAKNLLDHPDGFLTQLFINQMGAVINQMTEDRFWADIAHDYSQPRYDALVLLCNNTSYIEGYMALNKIPPASKDHVLFVSWFNLLLFEKIIYNNPKYICIRKEAIVLYYEGGHGTLEEFIQGLKILAESIKNRRSRFNQFGDRIPIEVKKPKPGIRLVDSYKLQDLLDLNQQLDDFDKDEAVEGEIISEEEVAEESGISKTKGKKNKSKKGQKKMKPKKFDLPQEETDPTKPTQWELAHPLNAVRNIGKIFRDGDADISQGFVDYLKEYTPPKCEGMTSLPNPKNCKFSEEVEIRREEERQKVLSIFGLQQKKETPRKEKGKIQWTNVYHHKDGQTISIEPPPGLSIIQFSPKKDDPCQVVDLAENGTGLELEVRKETELVDGFPSENAKTDGDGTIVEETEQGKEATEQAITTVATQKQDKAEEASYCNKAFSFGPEVKQQIQAIIDNSPFQYRSYSQPNPLINWKRVNINFPPEPPKSSEYLLSWKWPKKSFKVIRNILKRAVLNHNFPAVEDIHNAYQNDLNNLFFYLFTIKNDGQYHLYAHFEFFINAIYHSRKDLGSSDIKTYAILEELDHQFRNAKSAIGYRQYKMMGHAPFLRKETNLYGVLSIEDFELAGNRDPQWRYKINQDVREGIVEVDPEYRLPIPGCTWMSWVEIMEWIGQYIAEVEPVWLSKDRKTEVISSDSREDAGYSQTNLIISNLWSDEVREKYDLPRHLILKSLGCQGMSSEDVRQTTRIEEFNKEIFFYRSECNVAPTMYKGTPLIKPPKNQVVRGVLLAAHGKNLKTPYLSRTQLSQTLRLLVELHRFGQACIDNFKNVTTQIIRIPPSTYGACMLLFEQIVTSEEERRLLMFLKKNEEPVICSASYLAYQSHLPTLLGTVRLLSHGNLDRYSIGLSWEEDETQERFVQNFTNFVKYVVVPPGFDLALLKYNLIHPEHRDPGNFIEEYSQLLINIVQPYVPQYKEPFTIETLKESMTIFSPYAAFISFYEYLKNYINIRDKMSDQEKEAEKSRICRKGFEFVEAVVNYQVYENKQKK